MFPIRSFFSQHFSFFFPHTPFTPSRPYRFFSLLFFLFLPHSILPPHDFPLILFPPLFPFTPYLVIAPPYFRTPLVYPLWSRHLEVWQANGFSPPLSPPDKSPDGVLSSFLTPLWPFCLLLFGGFQFPPPPLSLSQYLHLVLTFLIFPQDPQPHKIFHVCHDSFPFLNYTSSFFFVCFPHPPT